MLEKVKLTGVCVWAERVLKKGRCSAGGAIQRRTADASQSRVAPEEEEEAAMNSALAALLICSLVLYAQGTVRHFLGSEKTFVFNY